MFTYIRTKIIPHKYFLPALFILAFVVRAFAGWFSQFDQLPDFISSYGPTAEKLVQGKGFDNMCPPGLFFFLTPFAYFFKPNYIYPAILGQAVVGALLVFVLYKTSFNLFKNELAARLTAFITVFYPWFVYYSGQLSHEHWTMFWLCMSMLMLSGLDKKKKYSYFLVTGLVLGFACWTRSQFLMYVMIALVLALYLKKGTWQQIGIILVTVFAFVLLWATYNGVYNHVWTFTGGNADHNLYLGLNEKNKTGGGIWGRDAPSLAEMQVIKGKLPPEERGTFYRREAIRFVKEHPDQFLILACKKMFIFWRPYPTAAEYTNIWTILIIAGTFIPIVIFSILTVLGQYRNGSIYFLLLYIAQLNAIHLIFPGSLVYRFPIEPLLICLAGPAMAQFLFGKKK